MLTQIRLSLDSQIIAARPRDGCRTTYRKGDRIEKYNRLTLLFVLSRGLHHRLTLLKTAPMSDTFWDTFWDTFENTLFWHFVWHCFLHSFWHSQNRPASGRHFFKTSLSNVCNAFFTFVGSPPSARTIPPSPKRHFFRHLGLNPFLDTFFNTLFCHFLLSLFLDTLFRHMLVHTSFTLLWTTPLFVSSEWYLWAWYPFSSARCLHSFIEHIHWFCGGLYQCAVVCRLRAGMWGWGWACVFRSTERHGTHVVYPSTPCFTHATIQPPSRCLIYVRYGLDRCLIDAW